MFSNKLFLQLKNAAAVNKFNLLDDESGSEEDSAPVASQKTKKSTKNKDFTDNASNEMENDITNHVHEINTATESIQNINSLKKFIQVMMTWTCLL